MPPALAALAGLVVACLLAGQAAADALLYKDQLGPYAVESTVLSLRPLDQPEPLPLRVTWPAGDQVSPVIVFSHGMGGSRDTYQPLSQHWASHGYIVIQPSHGDSVSLAAQRGERLTLAEMLGHWEQRPKDVSHILDELGQIEERVPAVAGRLDPNQIGMGGHSFGAHTAQLLAGMHTLRGATVVSHVDHRPKAFVMISPQGLTRYVVPPSFVVMRRPILMVTGTHDDSPFHSGGVTWRMQAFALLPPGADKYLLFLQEAHHGFGGIAGPQVFPGSGPPNEQQVRIIRSTTTAFWDAFLREDAAARMWLSDGSVRTATAGRAAITVKVADAP
jgi:dienelactone hydrolase